MPEFKNIFYPSHTGINRIHARICLPDGKPRGIVQISHRITGHIGAYTEFMTFLAEHGYIAAGNDHLGHGRSVEPGEEPGFFAEQHGWDHAAADVNRLNRILKTKYPGLPLYYYGFSMGSFLVRTCLIRYPGSCDAAVICGTGNRLSAYVDGGYKVLCALAKRYGVHYSSRKISAIVFGSYNDRVENKRTHYDWLSRDPAVVDAYTADEFCGFTPTVGMYRDMVGGLLYVSDMKNIVKMEKDLPVMLISGSEDPVGTYGKGVFAAFSSFRKAGMENVTMKLYSGARHDLLLEYNRAEVMDDILNFIEGIHKE